VLIDLTNETQRLTMPRSNNHNGNLILTCFSAQPAQQQNWQLPERKQSI